MSDNVIRAKALDRLAQVKRALDNAKAPFTAVTWELLSEERREPYRAAMEPFVDAIADLLTAPRRAVATGEELDALPDGTIIRTRYGTAAQRIDEAWEIPNELGRCLSEAIDLPAIVLYEPEEANADA